MARLFAFAPFSIFATWLLVIVEAGLLLLFPFLLGTAVDGWARQSPGALYLLGGAAILSVVVGATRRAYDTRVYARFSILARQQIVKQERETGSGVSVVSARTSMVTELVEFLEHSMPATVDCVVGLLGAVGMLWLLNTPVFVLCLVGGMLIMVIYGAAARKTYFLNKGSNDESERTVETLASGAMEEVADHFWRSARWSIRLSDLETMTFSMSWFVMIGVLLLSVVECVRSGMTHGEVLSIIMYVFGFVENATTAPLFFQQVVRLREVSNRLASRTPNEGRV